MIGALGAAVVLLLACSEGQDPTVEVPGEEQGRAAPTTSTPATPTTPSSTTSTIPPRRGSGQPVVIAFAGDINFEGEMADRLAADPTAAVGPFSALLSSADVAVGNLETALGEGGTPDPKDFTFQAPGTAVDALRAAGFDTVSMANNHGMDFGEEGLAESLAIKNTQPDAFIIGIGANEDEAYAPFTVVVKGQQIAVIAATQVLDDHLIPRWTAGPAQPGLASAKRVDRLVAEVAEARVTHDTVIVYLHWGIETQTCPSGAQQTLAQQLVDAGADAVVGGHAHRLQGGGRLGTAFVHYGLGNFVFGARSAESARTGVLLLTMTGRDVDAYQWVPGRISGRVPHPLEGAEADEALGHWNGLRDCTNLAA